MEPGNRITGGAICDLWFKDDMAILPTAPVKVVVEQVQSCEDCAFEHDGKCLRTGKNATAKCNKFDSIDVIEYDQGDDCKIEGSCKLCHYSYLAGTVPRCSTDEHVIEDVEACCDRYQEALGISVEDLAEEQGV
jgi:uncharacterized protein YuzB (UPF0349 family)